MGDPLEPEGRFDDVEEDIQEGNVMTRNDTNIADQAKRFGRVAGPSNCAQKSRVEDAEDAAHEFRRRMETMDPALIAELIRARQAAVGSIDALTTHSGQQFASAESDDDEKVDEDDDNSSELADDLGNARIGGERDEGDTTSLMDMLADEPCKGLLDNETDSGPYSALARAKDQYGVDLIAAMDGARLNFFARIRLVNYIRSRVLDGDTPAQVAAAADAAILAGQNAGILADDSYLKPVVRGDVLLTVLDDVDEEDDADVARAVERSFASNRSEREVE